MKLRLRSFRRILVLCIIVLLILCLSVTAFADYAHGYLRYVVEDGSVTITNYMGREETVTVPAMIGGNPVSTIASGAFAGAESVTAIVLPDTVTAVEKGAFGAWQSVVYSGVTTAAEPPDGGLGVSEPAEEAPALTEPVGILTEDGKLVTTDDEGNLVMVDTRTGTETVLDDSQTYTKEKTPDGAVEIRSSGGAAVSVQSGGEVSFTDAEKQRVTVSTDGAGNTTRTVSEDSGDVSFEEADVDPDAPAPAAVAAQTAESIPDSAAASPEASSAQTPKTSPAPTPEEGPAAAETPQNETGGTQQETANKLARWVLLPMYLIAAAFFLLRFLFRKRKSGK